MSTTKKLFWLMSDRGTRFVVSIANSALVARALAPVDFGFFAQAILFFTIFDTVTAFGFPLILGARVSIASELERQTMLFQSLVFRLILAVAFALLAVVTDYWTHSLSGQHYLLAYLILALSLTNWTISDSYLQGIGHPERGAFMKSSVAVLYLFIRWAYIGIGAPSVIGVTILYCAEQITLSMVMFVACTREQKKFAPVNLFQKHTGFLRHAFFFWSSQLVTLVYMRADQTIISLFGSKEQLAQYSLASQLMEQAYTLPVIANAVFVSRIGKLNKQEGNELQKMMTALYRYGFYISLVVALVVSILSPIFVPMMYGRNYSSTHILLSVLIFSLPFVTLGTLQSLFMLTVGNPAVQLKKTALAAALSVPFAIVAWRNFGTLGVAISAVIVQIISCVLSNYIFDPLSYRSQMRAMLFLGVIR